MNRLATTALLLTAAAAGFAAGWLPSAAPAPRPGPDISRRAAPEKVEAPETAAPAPLFPALETVDACRDFLLMASKDHASRHPSTLLTSSL